MQVIPVLDLAGGVAVHARRGERAAYRPVQSCLAPGTADPVALCRAFRSIGFDTVYVADLDAIGRRAGHNTVIERIRRETGLHVMLDAGVRHARNLGAILYGGIEAAVVGTETLERISELPAMVRRAGPERLVFSLALRAGTVLSPDPATRARAPVEVLGAAAAAGVRRAILLDLALVGTDAGPDLPLLRSAAAAFPGVGILAGGGVRGMADLQALRAAGAAGCLVATCLHTGALSAEGVQPWIRA